jgi:hypothetical protein
MRLILVFVVVEKRVAAVDVNEENSHLVRLETAHTPPTWRATIDEIWSVVHRGVCLRW